MSRLPPATPMAKPIANDNPTVTVLLIAFLPHDPVKLFKKIYAFCGCSRLQSNCIPEVVPFEPLGLSRAQTSRVDTPVLTRLFGRLGATAAAVTLAAAEKCALAGRGMIILARHRHQIWQLRRKTRLRTHAVSRVSQPRRKAPVRMLAGV